jgi:hypothetical protein
MRSIACVLALATVDGRPISRGVVGRHRETKLLETWGTELDHSTAKTNTPVTRVVNLLKEMQGTLQTEMQEDEDLYEKMECWCNTGKYEKEEAISNGEAKVEQLTAANEGGFAKSKELAEHIKQLGEQIASDKEELKTAQAKRDEEVQIFQGLETDSIQGIENMKSALEVLSRHVGAFPQLSELSFLQIKDEPMGDHAEEAHLEAFMQGSGYEEQPPAIDRAGQKFLQTEDAKPNAIPNGWTAADLKAVKKALHSGYVFTQAKTGEGYYPAYESQSGAIVGVLKQMKEQMEADLKEAQEKESTASSTFAELRQAKTAAIEAAEKMEEEKEAVKAETDNLIAEAKEDLGQTEETLTADKTFLANLEKMCADRDAAFEKRTASRLEEIKAVTETIEILTGDEARDAMSGTYSFLQTASQKSRRQQAASLLRKVALKTHNPEISFLASSVELDAFTKVKKAIDDMVVALKQEQADEVKKNDYCTEAIQSNEMDISKADDLMADLNAKVGELESNIKTFNDEIEAAIAAIAQAQLDLQRASEDRQKENLDFQKTIADQTITIEILHKAMERLAQFYDAQLVQLKQGHKQTPPVAQAEYKPNAGASGIMSMIEKLIYDAKELIADSKKAETEAQEGYETMVADTNQGVNDLAKEVSTKKGLLAQAEKDKVTTESEVGDTMKELEGLHGENSDLHKECDYLLKNFMLRQKARGDEIEALQQAKQILDGANLS